MARPNKKLPTVFVLLCLLPPPIDSLDFDFSSFAYNQTYINTEGDAYFEGPLLYLSFPKRDSVGRVLYHKAMQLWELNGSTKTLADFTTHFSFQILNVTGYENSGHGLAFVLVGENNTLSPTSYGGLLGMFASDEAAQNGNTRNQVVAVEFDTYQDEEWDHSKYHIGIDVNSIVSKSYTNVTDGFIDQGSANVLVVYNARTKNLSASLTLTADTSKSYVVSYVVDLSLALPQRVRVGFTATTRVFVEAHQLNSWSFKSSIEESFDPPPISSPSSDSHPSPSLGRKMVVLVVGLTAGLFAVIVISGVILYLYRARRNNVSGQTPLIENPGPKRFSYVELSKATNNFDEKLKLGEGGFGDVYKGKLVSCNEEVAVKRFRDGSRQGKKEYMSEVNIISTLKHKNLVQLKGWCHENRELIVVYDFMPNRSLDFHLFEKKLPPLSWSNRYKITIDLALALHYLQDGSDPFVLHRDIKASNIMLDSNFNAKLGDFGLARVTPQDKSFKTTLPAGTIGYLAQEVIVSGKVSKASDIYSFGVVALEIASGRRSIKQSKGDAVSLSLVEWVWDLFGKGSILDAVDKRLNGDLNQDQARRMMVVGMWCCHPDRDHRPSIRQVQAALDFEALEPNLSHIIPRPTYVSSMEAEAGSSAAANNYLYTSSYDTNITVPR